VTKCFGVRLFTGSTTVAVGHQSRKKKIPSGEGSPPRKREGTSKEVNSYWPGRVLIIHRRGGSTRKGNKTTKGLRGSKKEASASPDKRKKKENRGKLKGSSNGKEGTRFQISARGNFPRIGPVVRSPSRGGAGRKRDLERGGDYLLK